RHLFPRRPRDAGGAAVDGAAVRPDRPAHRPPVGDLQRGDLRLRAAQGGDDAADADLPGEAVEAGIDRDHARGRLVPAQRVADGATAGGSARQDPGDDRTRATGELTLRLMTMARPSPSPPRSAP